jgi:hypothetical protein
VRDGYRPRSGVHLESSCQRMNMLIGTAWAITVL